MYNCELFKTLPTHERILQNKFFKRNQENYLKQENYCKTVFLKKARTKLSIFLYIWRLLYCFILLDQMENCLQVLSTFGKNTIKKKNPWK